MRKKRELLATSQSRPWGAIVQATSGWDKNVARRLLEGEFHDLKVPTITRRLRDEFSRVSEPLE